MQALRIKLCIKQIIKFFKNFLFQYQNRFPLSNYLFLTWPRSNIFIDEKSYFILQIIYLQKVMIQKIQNQNAQADKKNIKKEIRGFDTHYKTKNGLPVFLHINIPELSLELQGSSIDKSKIHKQSTNNFKAKRPIYAIFGASVISSKFKQKRDQHSRSIVNGYSQNLLNSELQQKEARVLQKLRKDEEQQILQIRSIELNKSLQKANTSRSNRNKNHVRHNSDILMQKQNNNVQNDSNQTQADELFCMLSPRMKRQQKLSKLKEMKKNCYYANLKNKLQNQIKRIQNHHHSNLTVQGVRSNHQNKKIISLKNFKKKSESRRPKTATSEFEVTGKNSDQPRLQTNRTSDSKQKNVDMKLIRQKSARLLAGFRRQAKNVKEKERKSVDSFKNRTQRKSTDLSLNKSQLFQGRQYELKLKQKVIEVLNEFNKSDEIDLNSGGTMLDYYCRKIHEGFKRKKQIR